MVGISDNMKPRIVSTTANTEFEKRCSEMGCNPASVWVGGYVDYQWERLPRLLNVYGVNPTGLEVLEFGSNVGASAIVFASLGARVTAVDVSSDWLSLARLNAARYGIETVDFLWVPDTRVLPLDNNCCDLINCASVLEYVDPLHLSAVQQELNRLVKSGGRIVVTGTSNRIWPQEMHTRRWLVNYIPRNLDLCLGKSLERGVWPWEIRYGFGPDYKNLDACDGGRAYLSARNGLDCFVGLRRMVAKIAGMIRIGPGMLGQSMSCVLEKKDN
jgi:SAM-dependent methyltransferase